MSCKNCRFCQTACDGKHLYKCALNWKKLFDRPWLHGWFCKNKQ